MQDPQIARLSHRVIVLSGVMIVCGSAARIQVDGGMDVAVADGLAMAR